MIDWPEWTGYETCDGWSREVLVQRFTELRLAYEALERRMGAEIIDSWQACPVCGDLSVVANQFGWVCTRCGAHWEWNSEPCSGESEAEPGANREGTVRIEWPETPGGWTTGCPEVPFEGEWTVTKLKQPSADASGIALTTNSWWACPDCGGLAVANRLGWRCTRCGAHREWGSETCPGDYCEDGCDKCVGTP